MKPLIATREILCSSPRDALWVALADTAQLNRAVGNNVLISEPLEGDSARYLVETRLYGIRMVYEEEPFQWNRPEQLSITRKFRNGPAYDYTYKHHLSEVPEGGTLVSLSIEVAPRHPLLWPFLWVNTLLIANRLAAQVKRVDTNIRLDVDAYFNPANISTVDMLTHTRTKAALLAEIEPSDAQVGEQLASFVANSADVKVSRIRPFELAADWDVPRRTMVSVCLQAVVSGMLDLNWDIICPSCRTVATQVGTLSELKSESHCHLCDITIEVDLDRAVEATFRPSPAVRKLADSPYCIGGPFRTPHVVAQAKLSASGNTRLAVPETLGRYRLFVRGGSSASIEVAQEGQSEVEFDAGKLVDPAEVCVAPQGSLTVHDRLGLDRHVKLEHLKWASLATTAHYVSTVHSFRRMFSAEVLHPGLRVKVTRVALVFTDLTGSAAMYTRLGDALAYRFVQEHFAVLEKVIQSHDGSIVKTIGDAIMAVFAEESSAVKATIAMQQAFQEFFREQQEVGDVKLCVGMFAGPCYLVNANNTLDYFGQTVNIANRLQCQSVGGQITLPASISECAREHGWLEGAKVTEHFSANLKGLSEPLAAMRVVVDR